MPSLVLDTVIVYQEDFKFTVEDTAVARRAKQLAGLGRRVMVTYDRYAGRLPWQGRNFNVVTRIDTLEAREGHTGESTPPENTGKILYEAQKTVSFFGKSEIKY